jgi:hypothetical protein
MARRLGVAPPIDFESAKIDTLGGFRDKHAQGHQRQSSREDQAATKGPACDRRV